MGTYGLRVPASCVGYVPEAQGGFPQGPAYCTYWVRVPATGVPYVPRTVAPPTHNREPCDTLLSDTVHLSACVVICVNRSVCCGIPGVNGIRKTSAVYQPWFKTALAQALEAGEGAEAAHLPTEDLPDGNDSYFRQLHYMIATVA